MKALLISLCASIALPLLSAAGLANAQNPGGKAPSRSEIEDAFIGRLLAADGAQRRDFSFDTSLLQPYGEELYILPGQSYQKEGVITRNAYFSAADLLPVWDASLPLESMANLFVCPFQGYPKVEVELTVLKHEYGEKQTLTVPLSDLLAVCEGDGCTPFWGVESYEDGIVEGALFLYNAHEGYDHVFRVRCNAGDILSGKGTIVSRASLFVPTANVYNLFEPCAEKPNKQK